jgi:hypothetical protein
MGWMSGDAWFETRCYASLLTMTVFPMPSGDLRHPESLT